MHHIPCVAGPHLYCYHTKDLDPTRIHALIWGWAILRDDGGSLHYRPIDHQWTRGPKIVCISLKSKPESVVLFNIVLEHIAVEFPWQWCRSRVVGMRRLVLVDWKREKRRTSIIIAVITTLVRKDRAWFLMAGARQIHQLTSGRSDVKHPVCSIPGSSNTSCDQVWTPEISTALKAFHETWLHGLNRLLYGLWLVDYMYPNLAPINSLFFG